MQVNKNNISQFLTATNMCFMIPVYQRNYDWTEENCKQLWSDIWDISQNTSGKTHFLGTICSKTNNSHEKTIIDGQQRITTITLLMEAIHDSSNNEKLKQDINTFFLRNTGFGVTPDHEIKLHLNRRDNAIYNTLLNSNELTSEDELTASEVNSRIYQNYVYFYKCVEDLEEEQLLDIASALDRIVIVDLDVENENPQEIFESLNSTGLDLTDVDLLRNFLLMSLDYDTQTRLYDAYWYKIEENVRPENMVRFFVDYLIYAKQSDAVQINGRRAHVNEHNLYIAFKDFYKLKSGKKEEHQSQPDTTEEILKDMLDISKDYKNLVFNGIKDMNNMQEPEQIIYSIVVLNQAEASRPILIYIVHSLRIETINEDQALTILKATLALIVRAKVVGTTGGYRTKSVFFSLT